MKSAFTLIEILIAITIGMILLSIGTVKYADFNDTQSVKTAGLNLKNSLREIQGKALAGIKTCSTGNLSSYQVDALASAASFSAQEICSTSIGSTTTYNLPKNTKFNNNNTINFFGLGKGATVTVSVLTLSNTNSNKWYSLCVATSGEIVDCGYSRGTPPACSC